MSGLLTAHAAVTAFLCGMIWTVQLVHYPLFANVGPPQFVSYEREHQRRIGWLVMPTMLAELGLAVWLAWRTPSELAPVLAYSGLGLVLVIWTTTWLASVPCHRALSRGFEAGSHRRLVRSNWLRTAAWTLRAGLAFEMLRVSAG